MTQQNPETQLQPQFSDSDAKATPWPVARKELDTAQLFWLSTVRPDGRPHVTPLMAVWLDETLFFCTGVEERKAKNLAHNAHCILTTGCNSMSEGLDVVVEGDAIAMHDAALLQRVADVYASKYGWKFTVQDGMFRGDEGNVAVVYQVKPVTAFGFGKGKFSQTRWQF